jgi:hypothetical protein
VEVSDATGHIAFTKPDTGRFIIATRSTARAGAGEAPIFAGLST